MVHVQFKIDNINMKKYKLGDFLDNYGDGIHGTPKYDINGDYYFINGSNLGNGKIVINDDTQKVSAEEYAKIRRPIVNGQTILVSINGTLGKFAIYYGEKIGLGKSACFLNLKEAIYVPFIFAILMTKEFKTYLHNIAGQSTIKNVSPNQIANYEFYTPSSLCDCIAYSQTILKINEKIELNRQINDNLEAMAKQLYDYWFVQFDFPNEEGKPYKSSGGAMVWNDKLKREIPQGWDFCVLEDLLTIRNGRDHKHLADGIYPVYGSGGEMRKVSEYLYDGESVLMPRKGSLNNIMYVNEAFWTVDTMFYSEMKLSNCAKYIYYTIKDIDFTRWDSGTGVPSMTSSTLYSIKLVKPQSEILKKFDEVISPLFEHMKQISEQNSVLTKQRDELIPLLMNGQASINYHLSDD